MIKKLSADSVRRHRAKRLGLDGIKKDIVELADGNGGFHAISFLSPYLSLIARRVNNPFHTLNNAQLRDRKLIRIRAMRGTLFILPSERIPMMLGAFRTKPRIINAFYAQWEIEPGSINQLKKRVLDALRESPLSQKDLRISLADIYERRLEGNRKEKTTMLNFILQLLQMEGMVISEKIVSHNTVKNATRFVRVAATYHNLKKPPPEEKCFEDLIHWYFDTQGPADFDDLAWWSGIGKLALKKVIDKVELKEVEVGENNRKMLITPNLYKRIVESSEKSTDKLRLLPYEDPYLKSHKERSLILSGVPDATVFQRGEARPTILFDGRVVGLWRFVEHGEELRVGVEIFDKAVVDLDALSIEKEKVIAFASAHFKKTIDNYSKGIFTGTEPYS